jgi:hypothetical protein
MAQKPATTTPMLSSLYFLSTTLRLRTSCMLRGNFRRALSSSDNSGKLRNNKARHTRAATNNRPSAMGFRGAADGEALTEWLLPCTRLLLLLAEEATSGYCGYCCCSWSRLALAVRPPAPAGTVRPLRVVPGVMGGVDAEAAVAAACCPCTC